MARPLDRRVAAHHRRHTRWAPAGAARPARRSRGDRGPSGGEVRVAPRRASALGAPGARRRGGGRVAGPHAHGRPSARPGPWRGGAGGPAGGAGPAARPPGGPRRGPAGRVKAPGRGGRAARAARCGRRPGAVTTCWPRREWRRCRGERVVGGPLVGGQGSAHGWAACRLDREPVWGGRRAERRRDSGPTTRGGLTGGGPPRPGALWPGRGPAGLPDLWSAGRRAWCHKAAGADRLGGPQAPAARAGGVWRPGAGVAGQGVGPAGGGGVAGGDARVCPLSGDRLLRSRGGGDTAVPPGAGAPQTDHPPAASAHRDTDQREGAHAPMEQGASRAMVQQLGHLGTPIARGMPCLPRVQGGARPLQLLGGVTRGEAWRWPVARGLAPSGPRAAGPAWRAVDRVAGGKSDDSAPGSRPRTPVPSRGKR